MGLCLYVWALWAKPVRMLQNNEESVSCYEVILWYIMNPVLILTGSNKPLSDIWMYLEIWYKFLHAQTWL